MKCKKLRRILFKYIDGQLSERKSMLVDEHICDCPECDAEAESLRKMRSLLQKASRIEVPDTYWDTYWDRLEKKLPDEPSPVTLQHTLQRMSRAVADLFRQPAVLGRVAIYVLLLAILLYVTPDRHKGVEFSAPNAEFASRLPMGARESRGIIEARLSTAPSESEVAGGGIAGEDKMALSRHLVHPRVRAGLTPAKPEEKSFDLPMDYDADYTVGKKTLGLKDDLSVTEEQPVISRDKYSWAAAAKPPSAPAEPLAEAQDRQDVMDSNGLVPVLEDEYVAAENYFKEGEYLQAIPAYQNFIEANVKANVDDDWTLKAKYQIGEAYYQIGNYPEALSNFAAVVTDEEASRETAGVPIAGVSGLRKRDEKQRGAASELKEAEMVQKLKAAEERGIKVELPEASRGRAARKGIAQLNGDLPKTREELISQALFRQAQSYERLGRSEEALTTYRKYVERYPQGKYLPQAKERLK